MAKKTTNLLQTQNNLPNIEEVGRCLYIDICQIIDATRNRMSSSANAELTLMYWHIGERINKDVLGNERAAYGKQIVATLSRQLTEQYGMGFDEKSVRRMMQFSMLFPDFKIVATLSRQLPWSHFKEVLPTKDPLAREFYVTLAASEHWSVRELRQQIDGMMYERTLISQKPEEVICRELEKLRESNTMTPDLVFKSSYFLEFTGLKGYYSERDLEDMLLTGIQQFLMELGNGFSFIDRQKRIVIDGEDYYIDLLFYHRKLRRLVAIELKRTRFKAIYKGQMELYLRWLDRYERQQGEESPVGLILCTEGGDEEIELLQLDDCGIKVAQYYTELPDRKLLKEQLKKQLALAHKRMDNDLNKK